MSEGSTHTAAGEGHPVSREDDPALKPPPVAQVRQIVTVEGWKRGLLVLVTGRVG